MKPIFADTSFFQALISKEDEHHEVAMLLSESINTRVVTSEWVLTELVNGFSRGAARRQNCIRLVDDLRLYAEVVIVPVTSLAWRGGYELFRKRLDKDWSLVDCISFQVMWDRKIERVLTFDEHFGQAGFEVVG